MKTIKSKNINKFKYVLFSMMLVFICSGFDEGCEPTPAPAPPIFYISSESSNNLIKYYFKCSEKVVIEKIEVRSYENLIENINFGYPFLVSNANETHLIKSYPPSSYASMFYFSGVSRTTGNHFTSVQGVFY
jgi:hypothetical protein